MSQVLHFFFGCFINENGNTNKKGKEQYKRKQRVDTDTGDVLQVIDEFHICYFYAYDLIQLHPTHNREG
jgi:hypothetical protein